MSAPETFDLEIEFPPMRVAAVEREGEIELISVVLNPEQFCGTNILRFLTYGQKRQLRTDWLAAHKSEEEGAESDRQASAAETRAHFRGNL